MKYAPRTFQPTNCSICNKIFQPSHTRDTTCSIVCHLEDRGFYKLDTGCIISKKNKTQKLEDIDLTGYTRTTFKGHFVQIHRYVCEQVHGPAPKDKQIVLHSCDTPACCNPDHLRWGDHVDNMKDMDSRNRRTTSSGEKNGNSKLTRDDVSKIKQLFRNNIKMPAIAEQFKCSTSTLKQIKSGKTWKDVE